MKIETVIAENPNEPKTRTLTVHDRCDRCGAQALVRVRLVGGSLDFCGHHIRKYENDINEFVIENDDREALLAEESGGAR